MLVHPGPAHAPPPRRLPRRAGPVLALAAGVLLLHGWLAALLAPGAPRAGLSQGMPMLLRSLPAMAAAPQPVDAAPAADAPAAPAAPAPRRAVVPAPARATSPATAPVAVPAAEAGADHQARTAPISAITDPLTDAALANQADGEPPPLYATRLPPPVQLPYTLRHNGRSGSATLSWQHDGRSYRLTLDALDADGRPLLAQASTGDIDAHGVAPLRFVDRRGGGRQRAANFRREIGRIGYSGPGHQHPAWPGAQDRLSWLAQLAAILAAAEVAPDALRLFVADATGQAGLWQLQRVADGDAGAVHWRREPPRPEGLQIDLWLPAPAAGPADRTGWPQRLLFTVPRSGDQLELVLQPPP